jgi:hypothetical protein
MDKRTFVKVYLEDDMADKICMLGGGDSHEYLRDGIKTALNIAVAHLLHSPNSDQQHGRSIRA